jgi:hypothetical protein
MNYNIFNAIDNIIDINDKSNIIIYNYDISSNIFILDNIEVIKKYKYDIFITNNQLKYKYYLLPCKLLNLDNIDIEVSINNINSNIITKTYVPDWHIFRENKQVNYTLLNSNQDIINKILELFPYINGLYCNCEIYLFIKHYAKHFNYVSKPLNIYIPITI